MGYTYESIRIGPSGIQTHDLSIVKRRRCQLCHCGSVLIFPFNESQTFGDVIYAFIAPWIVQKVNFLFYRVASQSLTLATSVATTARATALTTTHPAESGKVRLHSTSKSRNTSSERMDSWLSVKRNFNKKNILR